MTGLLTKFYYETRWTVLFFGTGLFAIMALLTFLLPKVLGDIDQLLDSIPFIRTMIAVLLGTDPNAPISTKATQAFLWVHPTVLSLLWAVEIVLTSRVPAGEIDRGSVDWLMGLPVSRTKIWVSELIGWLLAGFVVLAFGMSGHMLAAPFMPEAMKPRPLMAAWILMNLYAVYIAVAGLSSLVSAFSDRRLRAVGGIFTLLIFSFLLNFLAQFWEPAKVLSFLSVLEYYRPAEILESQAFPMRNIAILLTVGGVAWGTGLAVFSRRNICTV